MSHSVFPYFIGQYHLTKELAQVQPNKASMKWDTPNPGPQCKLTIQLLILS